MGAVASSVNILGVEFYPVTKSGAFNSLDWMLSRDDRRTRIVVTANPIMVMTAQRDPLFMEILDRADLLVPDGVGILWAARKFGKALPERVTGVDLTHYLLHRKPSTRIYLLGGRPEVAERARRNVEKEIPGAKICGTAHGYFGPGEEPAVVDAVRAARPDVILVGMGSPRQEKFIWTHRKRLGAKVAIGVGGVLDILAGESKRAPEVFQKAGLEWLYRLVKEPKRLRADLKLIEFFFKVQFLAASKRKDDEADAGEADRDYR
ncbi:MAG TPA: WecB/TagA/CpsF family glycosyltransferase [Firmicutes bacterium]|nr:WecB/TagA/CpsF family glycosyltransferase [Candidatus Fermentithermobacillaceae bacterium]